MGCNMNHTKSAILVILFVCMGQGKNHYTRVSINKIILLLRNYHNIKVKRRWVFDCIRNFLDSGLITRKPRFLNTSSGSISQLPSMVSFTLQGAEHLVNKKVRGAQKLLKSIIRFITKSDSRWPKKCDVAFPTESVENIENKRRLGNLLGTIVGDLT